MWGTTAQAMAGAQLRAVGGFLVSVGLVIGWALLLAPHARVDRLPSLVRELRCDLAAVDLTCRADVIAGLALLDRLEPDTRPRSRFGSPSHPGTTDRARAVWAYPGGDACDPVEFGARFLLTQASRPPAGGTRRRVAELTGGESAGVCP